MTAHEHSRDRPRVFLSYARADGEVVAEDLRRRLERDAPALGFWQDRLGLRGGIGWWRQIVEALEVVEHLVLVMTPAAMRSETCQREWRLARQLGVCVHPVKGVADELLDYGSLPRWMRKAHVHDLEREWDVFLASLKMPCQVARVPFMAPDLPARLVRRTALLREVKAYLLGADGREPQSRTVALRGAGGLGKTTLATEVCHDEDILAAFDDGILWVTLGERPQVLQALAKLHAALTGERPSFVDEEDAAFHLAERLEGRTCLVVLDDVWSTGHLSAFHRVARSCAKLITTRSFEVAVEAERIDLDVMQPNEAVQLLTRRVAHRTAESARLSELAAQLHHWPLLLELAGATLADRIARGDSQDRALAYLQRKLEKQGVVAFDRSAPVARHDAIAATIEASLALLSGEERAKLAQLSVLPEDAEVPLQVVAELCGIDAFDAEELAQRLESLALLKLDLAKGEVCLHDIVRNYLTAAVRDAPRLHGSLIEAWGYPALPRSAYAWRWLPYHLLEAGRAEELGRLLLSFGWIDGKLCALGVSALLEDYASLRGERSVGVVEQALRLSAHVLAQHPAQLSSQLLARLPAGDEAVAALREACRGGGSSPWLEPRHPLLTAPGSTLLATLTGHQGRVRCVRFLAGGSRVASASDDGTIRLWDIEQGVQVGELRGHTDWVRDLAATPDGQELVSVSDDHTIRFWDLRSGTCVRSIDTLYEWLRVVALAPDAKEILTAADDASVQIRAWDDGEILGKLEGHVAKVNAIAVLEDGRVLTASDDRTIRLWQLKSRAELAVFRGHAGRVQALAVVPGAQACISAGSDDSLRRWPIDATAAVASSVITAKARWVRSLAVTPDGTKVVTAPEDRDLELWDASRGERIRTLSGHADWIQAVAMAPDGRHVVSASDDRTLKVWDLAQQGSGSAAPERHSERVRDLALSPDGERVWTAGEDISVREWSTSAATLLRRQTLDVHRLACSSSGRLLACCEADAVARVRSTGDFGVQSEFRRHADRVRAIAVSPDDAYVVSAGDDKHIRIWRADDAAETRAIPVGAHVRSLAFTRDGKAIVSGSLTGSIRVIDAHSGNIVGALDGHSAQVNAIRASRDGRLVLSASHDHTARVWDLVHGRCVAVLAGHAGRVRSVALASNCALAVSAADDCTVRTWSIPDGRPLAMFTGEHPFLACGLHESIVVAGDRSGLVHFLEVR